MPHPLKDPAVRQRRNRESTAATLRGNVAQSRDLPPRDDGLDWHREALDIWRELWASPMAKEYTEADVPGLRIVADLTHEYWTTRGDKTRTAAELRQQRGAYGLDPIARRRLGWKLEAGKPEPVTEPLTKVRDPRLRAVS